MLNKCGGRVFCFLCICCFFCFSLWGQGTKLVMLGTGTPNPDPDRAGPAAAVVVNGEAYLVDCGSGVVRRAAAAQRSGIAALSAEKLARVFITHLHSDHTLGYPDLILTPWVEGRTAPLDAYGPVGLRAMTDSILAAWSKDIAVRTQGLERANGTGYHVTVHEVQVGAIYRDANVSVTAFAEHHGAWDEALGYRFQTADRVIVFSGDTAPGNGAVDACRGCDVLVHEVYDPAHVPAVQHWQQYFADAHTSAPELARIANAAHPKLLVLDHELFGPGGEAALVAKVKAGYGGRVVSAHDLDVY